MREHSKKNLPLIFKCFPSEWRKLCFRLIDGKLFIKWNWPEMQKIKWVSSFDWVLQVFFPAMEVVGKTRTAFDQLKEMQDCPSDVRSADATAKQIIRNKVGQWRRMWCSGQNGCQWNTGRGRGSPCCSGPLLSWPLSKDHLMGAPAWEFTMHEAEEVMGARRRVTQRLCVVHLETASCVGCFVEFLNLEATLQCMWYCPHPHPREKSYLESWVTRAESRSFPPCGWARVFGQFQTLCAAILLFLSLSSLSPTLFLSFWLCFFPFSYIVNHFKLTKQQVYYRNFGGYSKYEDEITLPVDTLDHHMCESHFSSCFANIGYPCKKTVLPVGGGR